MPIFRRRIFSALFVFVTILFLYGAEPGKYVMATGSVAVGESSLSGYQEEQNPTPVTVVEAEKIFDARRFPAPGGNAAENHSTAATGIYEIFDEFENVTDLTKKAFKALGWETIKFDDSTKDAAMIQVTKNGLFVNCSISKLNKSATRIFLMVVGNVDLRKLPKANVVSVEHDRVDLLMYRSELDPDGVLSFYDKSLGENGWQRYESFGDQLSEGERKQASFRFNGVAINLFAQPADDQSQVFVSVVLLAQDIPTPAGISDLRLDASLFHQSFQSEQTVPELLEYFVTNLKPSGRLMVAGRVFKDEKAAMFLTHPTQEPVFLEIVRVPNGLSHVYMGSPTRQVGCAMRTPPEFEIDYNHALPMNESQMHRLPFRDIPFYQPLPDGSGRTIAESVFYNTQASVEDNFTFFEEFLAKRDWIAGKRQNEFIGDTMTQSSLKFTKADAEITVSSRPWVEDSIRINIEGNGIQWPGDAFCQMLAREEAEDIKWPMFEEPDSSKEK